MQTPEDQDHWELELATRLTMVSSLVAMRSFADEEVRRLYDRIGQLTPFIRYNRAPA